MNGTEKALLAAIAFCIFGAIMAGSITLYSIYRIGVALEQE